MIVLLLAVTLILFPSSVYSHPIDMNALAQIESSNNPKAFNEKSGARGLYQITPIALKHFNQDHRTDDPSDGMIPIRVGNGIYWGYSENDLFNPMINQKIAEWYLTWLYDRTWTVKDTLIAYNWGIGNWRNWNRREEMPGHRRVTNLLNNLPKETQDYLAKYEELTGEKL